MKTRKVECNLLTRCLSKSNLHYPFNIIRLKPNENGKIESKIHEIIKAYNIGHPTLIAAVITFSPIDPVTFPMLPFQGLVGSSREVNLKNPYIVEEICTQHKMIISG